MHVHCEHHKNLLRLRSAYEMEYRLPNVSRGAESNLARTGPITLESGVESALAVL